MRTGLISFEKRVLARFLREARERQVSAASCYEDIQVRRVQLAGRHAATNAHYRERMLQDMANLQHTVAYHSAMARRYLWAALQMQEEGLS